MGPTISSTFGGAGLNYVSYGLITREVESVDSGYRSAMVFNPAWLYPLTLSERQNKKRILPRLATERIGSFGLTEPDHGSDPGGMKTKAKQLRAAIQLAARKYGFQLSNSRCLCGLGENQ